MHAHTFVGTCRYTHMSSSWSHHVTGVRCQYDFSGGVEQPPTSLPSQSSLLAWPFPSPSDSNLLHNLCLLLFKSPFSTASPVCIPTTPFLMLLGLLYNSPIWGLCLLESDLGRCTCFWNGQVLKRYWTAERGVKGETTALQRGPPSHLVFTLGCHRAPWGTTVWTGITWCFQPFFLMTSCINSYQLRRYFAPFSSSLHEDLSVGYDNYRNNIYRGTWSTRMSKHFNGNVYQSEPKEGDLGMQ